MPTGVYRRTSPKTTRVRLADLRGLQAGDLGEKCHLSLRIIAEAAAADGPMCVMFSGGRDSTVLADLVGRADVGAVFLMHNDTGMSTPGHLPRVRGYAARSGLEYVETTAPDPMDIWRGRGHWPLLGKRTHTKAKRAIPGLKCSPVQCCYWMKERPALAVWRRRGVSSVVWGNRAGESMRRRMAWVDFGFLFRPKTRPWLMAYPLAHWLDRDVASYISDRLPEFVPAPNTEGGCRFCATDIKFSPNNMMRLFQADRDAWRDLMLSGMGEQIARLNGLDPSRVPEIVEQAPELLLRVKWRNGKGAADA